MIDLTDQIHAIKDAHGGQGYPSPACRVAVAELWGYTPANITFNKFGYVKITPAEEKHFTAGRCTAHYALAQTPNGWWLYSVDYMSAIGGCSYGLSIWTWIAYPDRHSAHAAAIDELINGFQQYMRHDSSCQTASNIKSCQKIIGRTTE